MLKINVHVRRQKAGQKTLRSMALLSSCSNVHVRRQKAGHKKLSSMAPLSSHSMCMSPHGWRRCKNFTQVTTAWSLVCKIREAYACTLEIWLNINYIGILCCQMWEIHAIQCSQTANVNDDERVYYLTAASALWASLSKLPAASMQYKFSYRAVRISHRLSCNSESQD